MGGAMAHKVLHPEAVGHVTCISFLLSVSLRPWVPVSMCSGAMFASSWSGCLAGMGAQCGFWEVNLAQS